MLSPYAGLDSPISLQSWNHQLKVDSRRRPADRAVRRLPDLQPRRSTPSSAPAARTRTSSPTRWSRARPAARSAHRADAPSGPRREPTSSATEAVTAPPASPLRTALLAVIAVGLVLLGGGLAVALGIGRARRHTRRRTRSTPASPGTWRRTTCRAWRWRTWRSSAARTRTVRQLAFDISATQTNQAGRMQGWLAPVGPAAHRRRAMAWMGDGGHAGHSMDMADGGLMPGMATEEELAEPARRCPGTAFDVEFLRLMIRHHQGGLEMAEYAAEHADVGPSRRLAAAIAETPDGRDRRR